MTRILVIEDEEHILENIIETLELEAFDVIGAPNGETGIEMAKEYAPDLILCDIMMPDMQGDEVFLHLRNDPATATIPFIFLTALAGRAQQRHGMELGADDYLTKPFSSNELIAAVHGRLDRRAAIDHKHEAEMDHLRANLIHSLPHELRTPLTGLVGCTDLLMMDGGTIEPDRLQNIVKVMHRSTLRLQNLIENYLLYAQIEVLSGDARQVQQMRSESTPYASMVVEDAARQSAAKVQREADLRLHIENANVCISHDDLTKLIREVVDNAFNFSSPGSPVHVEAGLDGDCYVIVITDQGRGMTRDQIRSIGAYTQFQRSVYEQQGLGLGLVIAHKLAELYGGRCDIESTLDQGTTVEFRLPAGPV
jgi:signal transduction histidine kinase